MNSPGNNQRSKALEAETTLVTSGRDTEAQKGFVNPPVVHGSTVLYPTADDLHAHRGEFQYGRHGTPTTKALQEALMTRSKARNARASVLRPPVCRRSPPPCSRC
jgi:cystathionine beta-lyase